MVMTGHAQGHQLFQKVANLGNVTFVRGGRLRVKDTFAPLCHQSMNQRETIRPSPAPHPRYLPPVFAARGQRMFSAAGVPAMHTG